METMLARKPVANDINYWFDRDGFLTEPNLWNQEMAERIALEDGISLLTPKHWQVIEYVRGRYFENGSLPVMRLVCRANGLDRQKAHKLFGSCKSLWRVAGLPNPGEEANAYMSPF
jgi:dissimilatory sulfite reductase related protein